MFKRILVVLLVLGAMLPLSTSAQTIEDLQRQIKVLLAQIEMLKARQSGNAQQCFFFNRNMGVGASGRDVRELHLALAREGFSVAGTGDTYRTVESHRSLEDDSRNGDDEERDNNRTDRYTEMTAAAVSQFQNKYRDEILTPNGLSAPTGYFGASSRRKMNSLYSNCIKPIGPPSNPPVIIYPTPVYPYYPPPVPPQALLTVTSPNGGEAWQKGSIQRIGWKTDTITSCQVGQPCVTPQFTIYLNPAAVNCQVGQPCVTPQWKIAAGISGTNWYDWNVGKTTTDAPPAGAYYVQICSPNNYGGQVCDQSDSYFKIYDSDYSGNKPPTISGVGGPTALKIGETATWTVRASDPENGSLSYSVIWGDEIDFGGIVAGVPSVPPVQQSATFTHSYAIAGTYYPKFRVTDNSGQSNSTSLSVVVGSETVSGIDLALMSFELNADGPRASFCNSGSVVVNSFPLNIAVDGINRTFDMAGYKVPGRQCGTSHQWYYATWGLNSTGYHSAGAQVDPLGIYAETNESNNWLTATYNGGGNATTTPVAALRIISPNGGETFAVDSRVPVTWTGGQPEWEINIFLVDTRPDYYVSNSPILVRSTRNDGYESVAIPDNMPTAGTYKFRVACQGCASTPGWQGWIDDSDGTFTINGASVVNSVQVLSPNGGEALEKGKTHTISWGATGAPEVSVYLIKDSDPTYRLAIKHNHVSGRANSIEWAVPSGDTEAGSHLADGSDYRIWVIGGGNTTGTTAVEDKSDQPFSVR